MQADVVSYAPSQAVIPMLKLTFPHWPIQCIMCPLMMCSGTLVFIPLQLRLLFVQFKIVLLTSLKHADQALAMRLRGWAVMQSAFDTLTTPCTLTVYNFFKTPSYCLISTKQ